MSTPTTSISTSAKSDEEIKVLVVDDNSVDRQMIVFACHKLNAAADMASSGEEAIEKFKELGHRLVITDYMMEPMSGLELAKKLREIDPKVEIIVVSGSPSAELTEYVQANELAPIVTKPITPSALINSAIICLERNRGRREVLCDVALSNRMDDCLPLVGNSSVCESLREEITKLIQSLEPFFITGPAACGKLQMAHFVHRQGAYGNSVCLECHCPQLSPIELSEALISPTGELGELLKKTVDGTLIIHNLECVPMELQKALADAFDRITAKTHLIFVSNAGLDDLLDDGQLEMSLYFKLSLLTLEVPGLGERTEDLSDLIRFICSTPEKFNLPAEAANADVDTVMQIVAKVGLKKNFAALAAAIHHSVKT